MGCWHQCVVCRCMLALARLECEQCANNCVQSGVCARQLLNFNIYKAANKVLQAVNKDVHFTLIPYLIQSMPR